MSEPEDPAEDRTRMARGWDGTPEADPELEGQTLGDFRVLRRLGRGGMASVYLAEQVSVNRRVAVKVMSPELMGNSESSARSLARFQTEATAAGILSHPNIVQVYTVGRAAVGEGPELPFIAMEYVRGRNLSQIVKRSGPLGLSASVQVMKRAAKALSAAHEAGVVHRDIKPANILVGPRGVVKVADFGLSQITSTLEDGSSSNPDLTQTGQTVGTPRYMSPEQIEGRAIDPRTDLYSLGVTFFYVLAGRSPFDGQSPMMLATQHLRDAPPELRSLRPDVPAELSGLIHGLLEKDPRKRPQTAAEVLERLRGLPLPEDASKSQEAVTTAPGTKGTRREWASLGWKTSLAAVAVGLAVGAATRPGDPLGGIDEVPREASARDQYAAAMVSGDDAAFRAVVDYWPDRADWSARAEEQLLLKALSDPSRRTEARALVRSLAERGRAGDERAGLVSAVAEAYLTALGPTPSQAAARLTDAVRANAFETLGGEWREVLGEALRRSEGGRRGGGRGRPDDGRGRDGDRGGAPGEPRGER